MAVLWLVGGATLYTKAFVALCLSALYCALIPPLYVHSVLIAYWLALFACCLCYATELER